MMHQGVISLRTYIRAAFKHCKDLLHTKPVTTPLLLIAIGHLSCPNQKIPRDPTPVLVSKGEERLSNSGSRVFGHVDTGINSRTVQVVLGFQVKRMNNNMKKVGHGWSN